ncbi:MAG TPA: hypothetical protein VNX65_03780 [Patescibacteria group bacterium]|jgi:addiction module RelB/DinJ family antitoxin|nr:hypothetical protein [Patescibacteria group bacterium]
MNTVLNVKIDPELKKQAQQVAQSIGLPISTVVAASLREFVVTQSITMSAVPRLLPAVEEEILKRSADAKKGVNLSPSFRSLEAAKKWLGA